jgi:hypothetical protein
MGATKRAKKSYSLSVESIAFLETVQKERRAGSVSAVLEEILQAARRERRRASVERAITSYYDSLSDEEVAESRLWGEFALQQFPRRTYSSNAHNRKIPRPR